MNEKEIQQEAKLTKLIQAQNEVCKKAVKTIFSRKAAFVDQNGLNYKQNDKTPDIMIHEDDHFKSASSIFDINPPNSQYEKTQNSGNLVEEFVTTMILDTQLDKIAED